MSFLRSQASLRLWRASGTCQRVGLPATPRYLSQSPSNRLGEPDSNANSPDSVQSTKDQAAMISVEESQTTLPATYHPEHQPDYNARADHGTSYAFKSIELSRSFADLDL